MILKHGTALPYTPSPCHIHDQHDPARPLQKSDESLWKRTMARSKKHSLYGRISLPAEKVFSVLRCSDFSAYFTDFSYTQ